MSHFTPTDFQRFVVKALQDWFPLATEYQFAVAELGYTSPPNRDQRAKLRRTIRARIEPLVKRGAVAHIRMPFPSPTDSLAPILDWLPGQPVPDFANTAQALATRWSSTYPDRHGQVVWAAENFLSWEDEDISTWCYAHPRHIDRIALISVTSSMSNPLAQPHLLHRPILERNETFRVAQYLLGRYDDMRNSPSAPETEAALLGTLIDEMHMQFRAMVYTAAHFLELARRYRSEPELADSIASWRMVWPADELVPVVQLIDSNNAKRIRGLLAYGRRSVDCIRATFALCNNDRALLALY
jgi:hypothetical protein